MIPLENLLPMKLRVSPTHPYREQYSTEQCSAQLRNSVNRAENTTVYKYLDNQPYYLPSDLTVDIERSSLTLLDEQHSCFRLSWST